MAGTRDPHVSAALKHLRFGVSGAGLVFGLCLAAQLLVWGFVHFTDVRHSELKVNEVEAMNSPLTVVESTGEERITVRQPSEAAADVNRVEGAGSILLERTGGFVQTTGVMASIVLFVLMFQGVVVAGGGKIPGVEYAVTAGTWALVLALLSMPWKGAFPTMAFGGVFEGYADMLATSDLYRRGKGMTGLSFYGKYVFMPLLMLGGVAAVVIRFRMGVEEGVIVTHASQLDERLEREIRERKLGELGKPRAVGALNQAIGAGTEPAIPAPVAPPPPPPARSPMSARPIGEEPPPPAATPGGVPKRPI